MKITHSGTLRTRRAKEQKSDRICRQIDPELPCVEVNKLIMGCQFHHSDFPCDISREAVINAPTVIIIARATDIYISMRAKNYKWTG